MSSYPSHRSIRLRGYEYIQGGAYFVTSCTESRRRLFGAIKDGQMELNALERGSERLGEGRHGGPGGHHTQRVPGVVPGVPPRVRSIGVLSALAWVSLILLFGALNTMTAVPPAAIFG